MAERAKTRDPSPGVVIATSWDEDKSTKKEEDKNKGKGCDWSKSIQGMNFDKACTWFKDYENIASKVEKA